MNKNTPSKTFIQPLFLLSQQSDFMGAPIIEFSNDNYNKENGVILIDAKNDPEAIASFLNEYKDSPETLRSYAKEIERLLLWCIHIGKINISSLRRQHLLEYQEFLKNPTPKKFWCGPGVARVKKDGKFNEKWRPFVKKLSDNSVSKSINILGSFFNYLVQTNYLMGNPLAVNRRRRKKVAPRIIDRYLELDEIQTVLKTLDACSIKKEKDEFRIIRARYIVLLLFYTGLRIAEAANHRMEHFIERNHYWFLRIIGKGGGLREIPVPDELLVALADFRKAVGLSSPIPQFGEKTPLIPMQNLNQAISTRRIDQIIRWAFNLGAFDFEPDHPRKASKLRSASAHWLRHSYVTYLLDSGAPLKVAQENAGHSDVGTTMHYRHVAQTNRHAATRGLSVFDGHTQSCRGDKTCQD